MWFLERIMTEESNYVSQYFVNVDLDLCRYEFDKLVTEGMFLLHRYHSSRQDIFNHALQVQVSISHTVDPCKKISYSKRNYLRMQYFSE